MRLVIEKFFLERMSGNPINRLATLVIAAVAVHDALALGHGLAAGGVVDAGRHAEHLLLANVRLGRALKAADVRATAKV